MSTRAERQDRPERVIILDADDPMTEIEGQIVWREAHDRIVEGVRQRAYAEGHAAGFAQGATQLQPRRLMLRRRRTVRRWVHAAVLGSVALLILLFLPLLIT